MIPVTKIFLKARLSRLIRSEHYFLLLIINLNAKTRITKRLFYIFDDNRN